MPRVEYHEQPARSALTKVANMPFRWSLNPYTGCVHRCTFCYVRGFELRAGRPSDHRYGTNVRVKVGIVEQLARELARRSDREGVAVGTATDPYQPAEGRYRLTRGCIRELAKARTPISLITRGPLVVRDVDVLQEAARHAEVEVHLSIPTVDPRLWRATEPGTAPPHQRLRALRTLVDGRIKAGVALAPLLPGLSDDAASIRAVLERAKDAGACHAWMNVLNLRPGVREHFLEELAKDYPGQVERYVELYHRPYLDRAAQDQVRDTKRRVVRELGGIHDTRTDPILPELQLSLL